MKQLNKASLYFLCFVIAGFVPIHESEAVGLGVVRKAVDYFSDKRTYSSLKQAAKLGGAEAQYQLGRAYEIGVGAPKDINKAREWYRKAAEQGHAGGQYQLGLMFANSQKILDINKAINWYTKAAEQGHEKAQLTLVWIFKNEVKDINKAIHWHTKVAEQEKNIFAPFELGEIFEQGKGVPKDINKAIHWYTEAAERGLSRAQFHLGEIFEQGKGVPQDLKVAKEWFRKAAEQGHKEALDRLKPIDSIN